MARGKSHRFSLVRVEPGVYSRVTVVRTFKARVYSVTLGLLSSYEGHLRNLHEAWQGNTDASPCEQETKCPLLVATVILGFLSIFKKASSYFEALRSVCLSRCQMDVRTPVQKRRRPRAFFRVSTGDSDGPSSCEMKDEPAFKPLQGNPAFFRVRASLFTFHLRHQTQGPSHIPIAEGSLLLWCFWKFGLHLQSKPGNQLSSQDYLGYMELSSSCSAEIGLPLDLRQVSQGVSGVA